MKAKKIISAVLTIIIVITSLTIANFSAIANHSSDITITASFNQTQARAVFDMINEFRTGKDAWYWNNDNETITEYAELNELKYDYRLEEIAMQRAAEIALVFSHTRPNGSNTWTAYTENGIDLLTAVTCGENIAAGYATANEVNNAWREDFADYENQNHRRNLLNKNYKAVGIGHVFYNGYHFWAEEFSGSVTDTEYKTPLDSEKDCSIKISNSNIEKITLNSNCDNISIDINETAALPTVTANAIIKSDWNSISGNKENEIQITPDFTVGNENIAQINGSEITGLSEGKTTLTVTFNDTQITIPVTVNDPNSHKHTFEWITDNGMVIKKCSDCGETAAVLPFTDLENCAFYGDFVEYTSVSNKFITGTNPPERTLFSPTAPITRAMFVTILYRMAGEPYANNNPYPSTPFTDIADTSVYYYDAACWALDKKITNQLTFKPFDNVTREQTASFLFRYATDNGTIGDEAYKNVNLADYPDYNSVHGWAVEAMQWANFNGMITGTQQGYINPQGATQRIHATKILYGFGRVCNIGNFE